MQLRKVLALLCFFTSFAGVLPVVSQSASVANKKTAVRYLKLSEQYAADKKWEEAKSNAKIGLAYDDSIADLWYINAVSVTIISSSGVHYATVNYYITSACDTVSCTGSINRATINYYITLGTEDSINRAAAYR